ncbi:hypothetical protein FNO01nite_30020 [Flavobacterium noncentrifugens]|uniref:DUF3667 domain-containing protein n=1 Tax=Flavobacterium noncentrifugens TaxID=1128970 RepID=A0A1G9BPZ8_9FLAO|nr:DUF3667 domain-containing protein [Flavobacterium noncentrifugens]GEP52330.1 hypothetical protein FNO01nite_30020 [Flavobacterium noncentrifugens]SDK41591.1 Protein of unknown function [Flavobacterium noncentrifugens]
MAHHDIRKDKTCLNCFHVVENRFCPNCGQENTETRQSFGHLITHFAEDFTHYDNAFWTTIKYLLFRPALLTKEYLSGKRQSFVPPVKLYIFVSFVTFFLLSVLPSGFESNSESEKAAKSQKQIEAEKQAETENKAKIIKKAKFFTAHGDAQKALDSVAKKQGEDDFDFVQYPTVAAYDSVQKLKPESKRNGTVMSWLKKITIQLRQKAKEDHFTEKFKETLFHNIPKALFLYMPFFAFWLWVFHSKKRWFYFDHGIFTLHYFSFLLFTFSIVTIIGGVTDHFDNTIVNTFDGFLRFGLVCWWFFYFFRSHRKFYEESRLVSRSKGLLLFFINMLFIFIFLMILMIISALTTH